MLFLCFHKKYTANAYQEAYWLVSERSNKSRILALYAFAREQ